MLNKEEKKRFQELDDKEILSLSEVEEYHSLSLKKLTIWDKIMGFIRYRIIENILEVPRYILEMITQGFPEKHAWAFSYHASKWMLPRLRRFRTIAMSYPDKNPSRPEGFESFEEWMETVDKMIEAMELYIQATNKTDVIEDDETWTKMEEGFQLFGKYFTHIID